MLENTTTLSILKDNIHCDWYVVATDSKGNTKASMEEWQFSTYPFALVYPLSYEIIRSTNITFEWKLSTDTTSATYEIRIVNMTDSSKSIDNAGYANTFTKVLNDNTAYQWEAYEHNTIDHTVTRSRNTTQSFCVNIENEPPTNFNLLLPVDNEILNVATPLFSWTPSTDNDPWENPIYTLEIAPYGDFSNPMVFWTDQTAYTPLSELKNFTDYEWRVYASDGNSITYSIETFHFRTSVRVTDLSSVNVYPNPANNTSELHFTGLSDHTSITLYNIAGNVVFELPYWYKAEYTLILNGTDLKSGIYIYVIKDDKNNKKVGKFALIR
jgi:hypothetical protein